jgi:hypothetical protein
MLYALRMEQDSEGTPRYHFEALDFSQPIPPWPDSWGRWTLDAELLALRHEENYEVAPQRIAARARQD